MAEVSPRVKRTWGSLPSYLELASIGKPSLLAYLKVMGLLSGYSIHWEVGAAEADAEMTKL